ncbi:MAG: YbbR-like domain-containing protein [Bacteroidales bacterium]
MKTSLEESLKAFFSKKGENSRNQFYVFVICLLISIFIWFLVVISKETYSTVDYPVKFENTPDNFILVNRPDSVLSFRIASAGFELITLKFLTRKKPVVIDLSNLNLIREGNYYTSNYSTSQIADRFIKDLNISEEYVSISPANIFFRFEALSGKMMKVIPNLKMNFKKQFQLSDSLQVYPDSVMVLGPKKTLEKMQFVQTKEKLLSEVDKSQTVSVELNIPESFGDISMVPDHVKVSLSVEQYTESTLKLPVIFQDENVELKTFPDHINVTYLVPLKDYSRVDEEMFLLSVKIPDDLNVPKTKVLLIRKPSFVKVTKLEPDEVEFILIKN